MTIQDSYSEPHQAASYEECVAKCNSKANCGSIFFCDNNPNNTGTIRNNCILYKKKLVGSESVVHSKTCFTSYKKCSRGTIINR